MTENERTDYNAFLARLARAALTVIVSNMPTADKILILRSFAEIYLRSKAHAMTDAVRPSAHKLAHGDAPDMLTAIRFVALLSAE